MLKFLIFSLLFIQTSFYSLQFTSNSGTTQSMNGYGGKKVLLVNIASGSPYVTQLGQLQQLQQKYQDSLVVIAFPSNSFGHEPKSDSAIRAFCEGIYNTTFQLAQKASVEGASMQSVYNWLSKASENGTVEGKVKGDFQKYLISSSGEVIGVFAPKVSPIDTVITNAVMRDL